MTDEETSELRRKCQEHTPARLRLYRDEEHVRDVPIKNSARKKWALALHVVAELRARWTSVELCDSKDNVLDVYTPQPPPTGTALDTRIGGMELHGAGAELARMIIAAQREALTYRERESSAALNAMVAMMERVTMAVGTLANVHAATLEAQRQQSQVQLATVAQAAAAAAAAGAGAADASGDDLESMEIFKAIAPQLGEKLAQGILEKFGPMLVSMLKPTTAAPAATAAKKAVIDVASTANSNGTKGAA